MNSGPTKGPTPQTYRQSVPSIKSVHQSLPEKHGCGVDLDDAIAAGDSVYASDLENAEWVVKYLEAIRGLGVDPQITSAVVNTAKLRVKAIELAQLEAQLGMRLTFSPPNSTSDPAPGSSNLEALFEPQVAPHEMDGKEDDSPVEPFKPANDDFELHSSSEEDDDDVVIKPLRIGIDTGDRSGRPTTSSSTNLSPISITRRGSLRGSITSRRPRPLPRPARLNYVMRGARPSSYQGQGWRTRTTAPAVAVTVSDVEDNPAWLAFRRRQ